MRSLGRDKKGTILNNAQDEQIRLKSAMDKLSSTTRTKNQNKKKCEKDLILMTVNELFQGRQILINVFKSRIFSTHSRPLPSRININFDRTLTSEPQSTPSPIKPAKAKGIKTLLPNQIPQRLPIMLAQVKAESRSYWYFHAGIKNRFG